MALTHYEMYSLNSKYNPPPVGSLVANAMKQNQDLLYSLTHFDLSENPLGESQGPLVFLKEPQTVTTLNLSKCGLNFELVSQYMHSVIPYTSLCMYSAYRYVHIHVCV